jgi:ADP-heptose:LPS heptosyltransferase
MSERRLRVALVRLDGIGDALTLAPLVAALRDAGHELGAVLSTRNREAFLPATFSHVHALERIPWPRHGSTPDSYARALDEARAVSYDVALVASEEPEAYRFARAAAIQRRVGFTNGWEKPLKSVWTRAQLSAAIVRPASAARAREHEVETLFRLGAGLHAELAPTRDAARLRPLLVAGEPPASGCVVVQVASKYADRGMVSDAFAAIARALAGSRETIAVADATDEEMARLVAQKAGVACEIPHTVDDWKRRIASAAAVVTLDSGAAHVAGMLGTPCVDLFASGPHAAADVVRWSPWAAPSRIIVLARPPQEGLAAEAVRAVDELLDAGPA